MYKQMLAKMKYSLYNVHVHVYVHVHVVSFTQKVHVSLQSHQQCSLTYSTIDGDLVLPEDYKGPEHGNQVEQDVSEEGPLCKSEGLSYGDKTNYN